MSIVTSPKYRIVSGSTAIWIDAVKYTSPSTLKTAKETSEMRISATLQLSTPSNPKCFPPA